MPYIAMIYFSPSDSTSLGAGILLFYIIAFLIIAIPAGLILYLLYRSFHKPTQTTYDATSIVKSMITPFIILTIGIVVGYFNTAGKNSETSSTFIDSSLLLIPFVLGAFASYILFGKKTRSILLILSLIAALLFAIYHYPHIFLGK